MCIRDSLDRVGAQPGPQNLASDRVQRMRHHRPGMHVQTNTRTLSEHRGLPRISERPSRLLLLGNPRIVTRRGPGPPELSPPRGYPYRLGTQAVVSDYKVVKKDDGNWQLASSTTTVRLS